MCVSARLLWASGREGAFRFPNESLLSANCAVTRTDSNTGVHEGQPVAQMGLFEAQKGLFGGQRGQLWAHLVFRWVNSGLKLVNSGA